MKKLLALALCLLLLPCLPALAETSPAQGVAYDAEAKQLVVTLIENPTTGYQWSLTGLDAQALLALASDEATYLGEGDIVGAPSVRVWHFDLREPGEAVLTFAYERSWEANSAVSTLTLRVSLTADGALAFGLEGLQVA